MNDGKPEIEWPENEDVKDGIPALCVVILLIVVLTVIAVAFIRGVLP